MAGNQRPDLWLQQMRGIFFDIKKDPEVGSPRLVWQLTATRNPGIYSFCLPTWGHSCIAKDATNPR